MDDYGNNSEIDLYSLSLDVLRAAALDDAYEENDSLGTAYHPGFEWEGTWLSGISGAGIQRDDDYYRIDVSPVGYKQVEVELDFRDSEGDIDLELLDSGGSVLARSESVTDDERISYRVPAVGT